VYLSNLFESNPERDYSRFPCYKGRLKVSADTAWGELRERRVGMPYFVADEYVYFTDLTLTEKGFLNDIISGNPKETTLSNKKASEAQAIGSMLYRALNLRLISLKFSCVGGITADSVYYLPEDETYVKTITEVEGTYSAIRGFGPKIHSMIKPGSISIFFETRHAFRVSVPVGSWSKWIGFGVKAAKGKDIPSFKGVAILDSVSEKDGIGFVRHERNTFRIPLDKMYVPGSPGTLGKRGVFEPMLEFANFYEKYSKVQDSFAFLSKVFQIILKDDTFTFNMDSKGKIPCTFWRMSFEKG